MTDRQNEILNELQTISQELRLERQLLAEIRDVLLRNELAVEGEEPRSKA